ncbi:unnamed protein product [Closterium sp. NIES-53]
MPALFLRCPAPARPACRTAMASLHVLAFEHEGRPIQFDMWLDDLRLYLLSDSRDSVFLFDHTSGASLAPPATADSATRSQWLTHDASARLAIHNHLSLAEFAHFGQHRTAQALYDTIVARYSSPATAALGRLLVPYLFPELSVFATVEDLVTHLSTSNSHYRAALPAEFFDKNPPPMYITLYFIVTRLPDSLRAVRDHFLALDPTALNVDLLEQHLLVAETSVVAVGAARGTPCTTFFEGRSPSPLAPSYASAAAVDVLGAEDVGAASASGKRRSSKRVVGVVVVAAGVVVGAVVEVVEAVEVVAVVGVVAGVGALAAAVGAAVRVAVVAAVGVVAVGLELLIGEVLTRGVSGGSGRCPYVIRTSDRAGQTCGNPHTQHRYFSHLDDAWRAEFGDEAEPPGCAELLRSGVDNFDLDYDVILAAMYALSVSAEGDCYLCLPPDPGIEATALGATESYLPSSARAEALHTFTLDSVLARSSTVLPCHAVPSGSLSGLHLPSFSTNLRVSIYTCTRTGRHLATFTRQRGSSLYTLATEPSQVVASAQVSASCQVAAPCLCRLMSHLTLLWHHCLGHPSLPCLRGMHSRLLVSGLPRSLPPLPPSPAPPCLPCVEGRQRAAPRSSSFPPTSAPLQTLYLDVCSPARVSGQGCERYFLLGGEFSSDLLWDFCREEGILKSFTLPASPQQNGIAERRIGLVMEVARTSVIHAAAPHFLWLFAVRYTAHQLNLWPPRTIPCVFLGFPPDAPGWQFYHPTSCRVFPSQDVTFDESVPFYRLFPYRSSPPPPPPLFLAPRPPQVDPLPPQGPAPSNVSQVDPHLGTVPFEVAVDSGAEFEGAGSGGAEPGGAEPGDAEPAGMEPGGAEPEGVNPWGAESEGTEFGGAEPQSTASSGGPVGALPRLSPRPEPLSSMLNSHVPFSSMLFSSLSIAFFHSSASLLSKASFRVAGSPDISTGEKNAKAHSS